MAADTEQGEDTQEAALTGVVADQLYVLSTSRITLTTTFARSVDGAQILFPLADWQMLGHAMDEDPDQEIAFEALVPLDNIAYLLRDMSGEFREAVENLEALTLGGPGLSQVAAARMRAWLCDVAEQANAAVASLDRMGQGGDDG